MVQAHENQLQDGPCCQDPAAGEKNIPLKRHKTGFDDVTGNDHIHHQIGETPFAGFVHNVLFAQIESDEDHQEQGKLQIPQPYDIHGTPPLR